MGIFDGIGKNPFDREIAKYEKLASEKPENPSVRNILGDLYLKKGLNARAAQYFRQAVELFLRARHEEKAVALMRKLIGYDLYDLKEVDSILEGFLARGRKGDVIALYVQLARKKLGISRPLANDIFRKILEFDPANPEALLFFGQGKQEFENEPVLMNSEAASAVFSVSIEEAPAEDPQGRVAENAAAMQKSEETPKRTEETRESAPHQQARKQVPGSPDPGKQAAGSPDDILKNKFIDIAKEKKQLETTIIEQNDVIRRLEREHEALIRKFNSLSDANKKMKDKILDFDILRNMEISELRKKIEDLIAENRNLQHERQSLLTTFTDGRQRTVTEAGLERETLEREKEQAERLLLQAEEEIRQKDSMIARVQEENRALSEENRRFMADIESVRLQIVSLQEEGEKAQHLLRDRERERAEAEARASEMAALQERLLARDQEIHDLKVDIDELTHSMEAKIHEGDEVRARLALVESQLHHKEKELGEKIPFLRSKINRLSEIIDYKLEEHSLFAKELSDVNEKIVTLHAETIMKDELLLEISQGYKEEQAALQEINSQHEAEKSSLLNENEELRKGIAELKDAGASAVQEAAVLEKEKQIIEEQLSEALKKILELEHASYLQEDIQAKDRIIAELRTQHEKEMEALRENMERLAAENEHYRSDRDERMRELSALQARDDAGKSFLEEALAGIDQEKEQYRSEIEAKEQRIDSQKKYYDDALAALGAEVKDLVQEKARLSAVVEEQKQALAELQESHASRIADLMSEMKRKDHDHEASHADAVKQAQVISDLQQRHDKEVLQLREEMGMLQADLLRAGEESTSKERLITEIKQDLHREVAALVMEIEGLKEEKSNLQELFRGQEAAARRLADENARLAGLVSDAETGMEKLSREKEDSAARAEQEIERADQETIQFGEEPGEEKKTETDEGPREKMKAPLSRELLVVREKDILPEKKKVRWSYVLMPVVLAGIIFGGMFLFQYQALYEDAAPVPGRKASEAPLPQPLSYHEKFDLLTREQKTGLTRVQATMVTESLVKADPSQTDGGTFRFDTYSYFRISVNSLKGDMSRELIENPASAVTLVAQGRKIPADRGIALKDLKIFSRREQPVSVSFIAAFPRADMQGDMKELTLSVARNNEETNLTWNLQELQARQLIP